MSYTDSYAFIVLITLLTIFSCGDNKEAHNVSVPAPKDKGYEIQKSIPHDPKAFTQGLIIHNGKIIESTGHNGTTWISTLDPITLDYDKKIALDKAYFGEGITIFNNKIYQLTYKSRIGFVYDVETYLKVAEFKYPARIKEGWGITNNSEHLLISDGSDHIYFINSTSFEIEKTIKVRFQNRNIKGINELEYVNGHIYANVWNTSYIMKINPESGDVLKRYDLNSIVQMSKTRNPKQDVLNGIAYDPNTSQFVVTGKYWSDYYFVTLID